MRKWMSELDKADREDYVSARLKRWMVAHDQGRSDMLETVKICCMDYNYRHFDQVDIKRAIVWDSDRCNRYGHLRAIRVLCFSEGFQLPMPKSKAKVLLYLHGY